MAVYEVFKHSETLSEPGKNWYYFDILGKYLGEHAYVAGNSGGDFYILDADLPLPLEYICICKSTETFILHSNGNYTVKTWPQMLETLWPGVFKPSFTSVLSSWPAGTISAHTVSLVLQKMMDLPNKPTTPKPTIKYSWTLSSNGVVYAV